MRTVSITIRRVKIIIALISNHTGRRVKIIIALIRRFGIRKILIAATAKDKDAREGNEQ